VIDELHRKGEMTLRIAYNLFTQKPKEEMADFTRWMKMTGPGKGDDFLRCNGAGEMLVFSAADFEDFLEPRPDLASSLETELKEVVSLLAANKWPFRLHATYDESIHTRQQLVFEREREEGRDCSRPVRRSSGAHRRLFLCGGGTNQRHRIRANAGGRQGCPRDG
jgi:predicted amidohydrolase YtcJ